MLKTHTYIRSERDATEKRETETERDRHREREREGRAPAWMTDGFVS